jgi:8-oxo-dGTP diphosphatase
MTNVQHERPKVAVGVMIFKEGRVLMSIRKGSHGAGEYGFPGGHIEHLESFEDCVIRETAEECGLKISNIKFLCTINVTRYAPKHFVFILMTADWKEGEPQLLEPDKSEAWQWFALDALPNDSEAFAFCKTGFDALVTGDFCYTI